MRTNNKIYSTIYSWIAYGIFLRAYIWVYDIRTLLKYVSHLTDNIFVCQQYK